jgi:hypothetical protein
MCIKFSNLGVHQLQWKNKRALVNMLKIFYTEHWKQFVYPNNNSGKLQLYGDVKSTIRHEDYLSEIKNCHHRQALTKVRICAHSLAVKTGRYGQNRVPRELRKCTCCKTDLIEDEEHFLLTCAAFSNLRIDMLNIINIECHNLSTLSQYQKTIFMLSAGGKIIQAVAKFCDEASKARLTLLSS